MKMLILIINLLFTTLAYSQSSLDATLEYLDRASARDQATRQPIERINRDHGITGDQYMQRSIQNGMRELEFRGEMRRMDLINGGDGYGGHRR